MELKQRAIERAIYLLSEDHATSLVDEILEELMSITEKADDELAPWVKNQFLHFCYYTAVLVPRY